MDKIIRKRLSSAGFFCLVGLIVLLSLSPFFWFVDTSFKTEVEVTSVPPVVLPSFSLEFYRSAITRYGLLHFLRNSFIVASATTLLTISLAALAGYALSRLKFPFRVGLLKSLLVVSMFPQISIAGPVWRILYWAGLLNSYPGLVVPYVTLTLPLGVWVLTSFFSELPEELEAQARIDGCGYLQTLYRIILPLSLPGLFTAAILVFIYAWNEFFFALLIMTQRRYQTLPVGIALLQGQYTLPWGEIAAASTVATVPLVVVVFLFQKRIISGLSAGAIKG